MGCGGSNESSGNPNHQRLTKLCTVEPLLSLGAGVNLAVRRAARVFDYVRRAPGQQQQRKGDGDWLFHIGRILRGAPGLVNPCTAGGA